MKRNLTLRLDKALVARAKRHSEKTGRSLSRLVGDYFALLDADPTDVELTPRVRSLRGAGAGLDERGYLDHLEEKHR
ncbi:MAG: antitoxin [Actinobacteria bacterium]|nr:MAG: antitoxin [Actinomycetota bacterium]